jgi:glycosyltransferase involved in cell wall biosynthesis
MRILIDLQGAQTSSRFRGIGRYSLDITKGLLRNSGSHEIEVLLSGFHLDQVEQIRSELSKFTSQDKIFVWDGVGPTAYVDSHNQWRLRASELMREAYIAELNPDVILISSFFEGYGDDFAASIGLLECGIPVAVIFYDLIPYLYPNNYLKDPLYAKWYAERLTALRKADFLLAISSASKDEAIEYLGFKEKNVENVSSAVNDNYADFSVHQDIALFLRCFEISKPFLMYTSATDARKNHLRLIEAYAKLEPSIRANHQLVFAGGMPPEHIKRFKRYAHQQGLKNSELICTGDLTDDEMKALYSQCKAFVFPSWHEGFGLPILEAMQFGRAVIASNCSSIPEILECESALFDSLDSEAIYEKIKLVLTDNEFRKSLEANSYRRAKEFSWDKSAKAALTALDNWIDKAEAPSLNPWIKSEDDDIVDRLIDKISQLQLPCEERDLLKASQAISLNHRKNQKRQLLVDISVLVEQDAKTGIQRVVRNILRELLLNPPEDYSVKAVYASFDQPYRYAKKFTKSFLNESSSRVEMDDVIEFSAGDSFIGLDLLYPQLALKHNAFYQKMRAHGVKVQFVVYDLLPILLPQYVVEGAPDAHAQWVKLAVKFDGVICISQSVAIELKNWLVSESIIPPKSFGISWFHLGADPEQGSENQAQKIEVEQYKLLACLESKPSFLSVGTLEPRKGHTQVLDAFEQLWSEGLDINLVFVGKQGWKVDDLAARLQKHPEKGLHLFWLNGVDDCYLNQIYHRSSCLIAASEGEGFGLPLIEAAHKKIPIIARDIPVFREVAGNNAFYFSGKYPQDLVRAIKEWLALFEQSEVPDSAQIPWLNWKESAHQLLSALR